MIEKKEGKEKDDDEALNIITGKNEETNESLAEISDSERNMKRLEHDLKTSGNPWGLSPKALNAKNAMLRALAVKNGLYARVPIICKGEACPYSKSCQLLPYDLAPEGEYCPVEIAQIDIRATGYAQDIDYDEASFVDRNLMNELVTLDILLERCKALMAKEGTPVVDVAIGVDQEGNEIDQPAVSKSWEAYEKISKKRDQTYQLLMLTRKDKKDKGEDTDKENVSYMIHEVINATSLN